MSDFYVVIIVLGAICFVYLLPTIVAFARGHPNRWPIVVINLLFGATALGWFGALIWSFHGIHRSKLPGGTHGGESGLNLFANDGVVLQTPDGQPSHSSPLTRSGFDAMAKSLSQLHALRQQNLLSELEYTRLKAALLSRA